LLGWIVDDKNVERNIKTINDFLTSFREKEIRNEPAIIDFSLFTDDDAADREIIYFVQMLTANGFLREAPDQPDFDGHPCYRLTWKGHCFLDLYRLATTSTSDDVRVAALVAVTALH
jgi:hypothetical protein